MINAATTATFQSNVQARSTRIDPSRTLVLRRAFVAEASMRFRALKGAIRRSVVANDCFGLTDRLMIGQETPPPLAYIGPKRFEFARNPEKLRGFMNWLDEQEEKGILQVFVRPGYPGVEEAWSDRFIRRGYEKGIVRGRVELRKAGFTEIPAVTQVPGGIAAVFNQPWHADRVGLLYTRAFNELKGIDDVMDQQISRVLAQGLTEGMNPLDLARVMNDRVDKIGITRSRMLCRTEIMRAHHQGTMGEYRQAGVVGLEVMAEWETAGYEVCPICEGLVGQVFELDEIEGLIPLHPN